APGVRGERLHRSAAPDWPRLDDFAALHGRGHDGSGRTHRHRAHPRSGRRLRLSGGHSRTAGARSDCARTRAAPRRSRREPPGPARLCQRSDSHRRRLAWISGEGPVRRDCGFCRCADGPAAAPRAARGRRTAADSRRSCRKPGAAALAPGREDVYPRSAARLPLRSVAGPPRPARGPREARKREAMSTPELALSIVIPAYNEERRLPPTLSKIAAWLAAKGIAAEILVVDD